MPPQRWSRIRLSVTKGHSGVVQVECKMMMSTRIATEIWLFLSVIADL